MMHESPQWPHQALQRITAWLPAHLGAHINPAKTILQPVDRGVDFVSQVIKPWRRTIRRRTVASAIHRLRTLPLPDTHAAGNSYLGLMGQATNGHKDRARVAQALLKRGLPVNGDLRKAFRPVALVNCAQLAMKTVARTEKARAAA